MCDLLLSDKLQQEKLAAILSEIDMGLLNEDEDIVSDLKNIITDFNEIDKIQTLKYMNHQYSNKSFVEKLNELYQFQHTDIEVEKVNNREKYEQFKKKNEFHQILKLMKSQDFCEENLIPPLLSSNINILEKIVEKIPLIFHILDCRNQNLIIPYFDLLQTLIELAFMNLLKEEEQNILEQIIGSLLNRQIYQFQYYIDHIKLQLPEQYSQFVKCLQSKQLHIEQNYQLIQWSPNIQFLYRLFTQNNRRMKEQLNEYFIDSLLISQDQLNCKAILNSLEKQLLNGFNYQEAYFQVLWYFWSQHCQCHKINELIQLEANILEIRIERRELMYLRVLEKIKKQKDEIVIYFVHRAIYFSTQDDQFTHKNELKAQIKEEENRLIKHQCLCSLDLDGLFSTNEIEFLNFWTNLQCLQYQLLGCQNSSEMFNQISYVLWIKNISTSLFRTLKNLFCFKQASIYSFLKQLQYLQNESLNFKLKIFLIGAKYYNFQIQQVELITGLLQNYGTFSSWKFFLQFQELLLNKNRSIDQILIFFGQRISGNQLDIAKNLFAEIDKIELAQQFLRFYLEDLNRTQNLRSTFYILIILFNLLSDNLPNNLFCFKILLTNLNYVGIHLILKLNRKQLPSLTTVRFTIIIIYALYKRMEEKVRDSFFKSLNQFIQNKFYCFDYLLNQDYYDENFILHHCMIHANYFYLKQDKINFQNKCYFIFQKGEQMYDNWLQSCQLNQIYFVKPIYFKRIMLETQYPQGLDISLEDFNVPFAQLTQDDQQQYIISWIQQTNDPEKLKKLLPFFFNIVKRGESSNYLLTLLRKHKPVANSVCLNFKSIFQILYNNSNDELKFMLLKFRAKTHPIPLIYQNVQTSSIQSEEDLYIFNHLMFYIYNDSFSIINFSLTKNQTQIGKTQLINHVFYQMEKFEVSDTCQMTENTIDVIFDSHFSGTRNFLVADCHKYIPVLILSKILPLFKVWIIQMDSENQLEQNFQSLQNILKFIIISVQPSICFIVRNSIEQQRKANLELIKKITGLGISIHYIQDITQKGLDKQIKQGELDKAQKFIFDLINLSGYLKKENFSNQKDFLKVLEIYKTRPTNEIQQINQDCEIVQQIEIELDQFINLDVGFFSEKAFPMRSIDFQMKILREEITKEKKKPDCQKQLLDQLYKKLDDLSRGPYDSQTKLLKLFSQIFNKKNYYILYLWFAEKLRIYNEANTYQTQNKNQQYNEKIQLLKRQKQQKQGDEIQLVKQKIKEIKDKLIANMNKIKQRNIGIEIFWREIISQNLHQQINQQIIDPSQIIFEMIKKGEPFEFLDGDQLKIDFLFLKSLIQRFEQQGKDRALVFSILGPQSSGKSTILNKIFGCHFWTSVGRCTKGISLQLLKISDKGYFNNLFDYILLLDTEGLQNPNQQDQEFDKKIALFILAISDIILLNVKGDIHSSFRSLVEMCIYTLGQMKSNFSTLKQINWCFNQNTDANNIALFLEQIIGIASNLNAEQINDNSEQNIDYAEFLDIKKENIQVFGCCSYEKLWECQESIGVFQEWRQLINNDTFASEAYQYGIKIIKDYVAKFFKQLELETKELQIEKRKNKTNEFKLISQNISKQSVNRTQIQLTQKNNDEELRMRQMTQKNSSSINFEQQSNMEELEFQSIISQNNTIPDYNENQHQFLQLGKKEIAYSQQSEDQLKKKIHEPEDEISSGSTLNVLIQKIEEIWSTIQQLPDLLEFSELVQHQLNQKMKQKFDEIYNNQQFPENQEIQNKIDEEIDYSRPKSLECYRKIQLKMEYEISNSLNIIKKKVTEDLLVFKSQNNISKKISQKYLRQLESRINSVESECRVKILELIKEKERQYQEKQGFSLLEVFVQKLSQNQNDLKVYQSQPEKINAVFEEIWNEMIQQLAEQQEKVFDEYQRYQFDSITQTFTEYNLKSNHHQKYFDFFRKKVNKISPDTLIKNVNQKDQIFKKFEIELKQQQVLKLEKSQNNLRYLDILNQSIERKLMNSYQSDFINLTANYCYEVQWKCVDKEVLIAYFEGGMQDDLKAMVKWCQTNYKYQKIHDFLSIIIYFSIDYDLRYYKDLIAILMGKKNLSDLFWEEQQTKYAMTNFFQSLKLNKENLLQTDNNFGSGFQCFYPSLRTQIISFSHSNQASLSFKKKKLLEKYIIIKEWKQVRPNQIDNIYFQYIQNPQNFSSNYYLDIPQEFNILMLKEDGWRKLYGQIYDLITNEMTNSSTRNSVQSQQIQTLELLMEDESYSYSISFIKRIMLKIELQIKEYNKQFAKFGVIFRDIGERCIYYYSIFLIWRFVSYKKWKLLESNKCKLQNLKNQELEKFRAEITQNKAQQSQLKALNFVKEVSQEFKNNFLRNQKIKIYQYISKEECQPKNLILKLDKQLLHQNKTQINSKLNFIISYVRDQRKYVEDYVNEYIKNIERKIINEAEDELHQAEKKFLNQILHNANTLKESLDNSYIKTREYFKIQDKTDEFYENSLYRVVYLCLQGDQISDTLINLIDEKQQEKFKQQFIQIQTPLLKKTSNSSNEQIQQLKYYIDEVVKQLEIQVKQVQQNKLKINQLNLNNELDSIKLQMNGCQDSCPMCKRKCDLEHDKNSKHMCQNGHQLRGMNGVLIDNKPSLFTCEEIQDDALIITIETGTVRSWKEIVTTYPEWQFHSNNKQLIEKNKVNMIEIWNEKVGELICEWLSKEFKRPIKFEMKHPEGRMQSEHSHYILVLDDSGSMQGQQWENAKNGALSCMKAIDQNKNAKVSVVIFNSVARVAIDCEAVNIQKAKSLMQYQNGGTSFQQAFEASLNQVKKKSQDFNKIIILFYTDGQDQYPNEAVEAFRRLPDAIKQILSLIVCCEDKNPQVLQKIVATLKPHLQTVELKSQIQTEALKNLWTEIVSQNYHKLRC